MADTLYISDLDGTLLSNDARLSEFSRSELQSLLSEGLPFSVASARSVVSIRAVLEGLPITLPVVEFNGAFLSDLATGRHEVVNAIESPLVHDLYHLIAEGGHVPFVSTFNGREDRIYFQEAGNEGMRWYLDERTLNGDERLRLTRDLTESLREQVVCLTVVDQQEYLSELERMVVERHGGTVATHFFENPYSPGWHWLTIHDRRATKGQAVRTLMERYGLHDNELVVFGDHINDITIFQAATQAVAVANAVPEARRHATHVIGSNQEDSVVKYIREHWKKV